MTLDHVLDANRVHGRLLMSDDAHRLPYVRQNATGELEAMLPEEIERPPVNSLRFHEMPATAIGAAI